jgi:hypothetical protein
VPATATIAEPGLLRVSSRLMILVERRSRSQEAIDIRAQQRHLVTRGSPAGCRIGWNRTVQPLTGARVDGLLALLCEALIASVERLLGAKVLVGLRS